MTFELPLRTTLPLAREQTVMMPRLLGALLYLPPR